MAAKKWDDYPKLREVNKALHGKRDNSERRMGKSVHLNKLISNDWEDKNHLASTVWKSLRGGQQGGTTRFWE